MKRTLLTAFIAAITLFSTSANAQCNPTATSTTDYFIRYVKMVDKTTGDVLLVNESTEDASTGYKDYKALTGMTVIPGQDYKMMLRGKLNIDNAVHPTWWKVWIDIDENGSFNDAGEEVISKQNDAWGYNSFTMPALGEGSYTMRVAYSGAEITDPCADIAQGEIEDYTITVQGSCTAVATSTDTYFVRYVKMVDMTTGTTLMTNTTEADGGYGDYKAVTGLDVIANGNYKMMLRGKSGIDNTTNPTWWKVWIDLDGDGEFNDKNGEVISKQNDAWGYNEFKMPDLTPGSYIMRVATSSAEIPDACTDIAEGEIEDYTLNVLDAAQPTFVNDDKGIAEKNSSKIIDVLANDVVRTNPVASVSVATAAANGTAVANADNTITYTPNTDFLGDDTFTYTVTDDKGLVSDEATVTIKVVSFKGLVKIIEEVENGSKGVFDRDVSGSGQSMGLKQTQTRVDSAIFLNGVSSLELIYKDGDNATNPGDFDWYDRFGINHWAGGAPAAIPEMADHDHLYLSLGIKSTTVSYGAKASFLVKTKVGDATYYVQSEPVLLGNHNTNWNIIQIDLKDATKWGDWINPLDGKPILGGSNGVLGTDLWINAIIIQGTNNSPDMILNFDNLIVTTVELDIPEVNIPTEPLANEDVNFVEISAYPNPMTSTLNLDLSKEVSSVIVYSAIGTVVYTNDAPSKNLAIDTQAWDSGMYFVSVREGTNVKTIKVVK
jgi:hypothetical protein